MPDAVLTSDPIGGYRHPDHIHQASISRLKKQVTPHSALRVDCRSSRRALFFLAFSHHLLRVAIRIMPIFGMDPRRFRRNKDVDLKALVEFDFPVHVRIDTTSVRDAKDAAGVCHASQGGLRTRSGIMRLITGAFGENEQYKRAYPPVANGDRVSGDLLDGL